jgi:platelet-activating factor acetylhydrolase IB subunit alpha
LGVIGATNASAAFREEANVPATFDDATRKKYEGLLEKKWTSVVRLQKKVACYYRAESWHGIDIF